MLAPSWEVLLAAQALRRPQEFTCEDMAPVMRAADFGWAFFVSVVSDYADPNVLTTRPLDNFDLEQLRATWAPLAAGCDTWQAVVERLVPIRCTSYQPGRVVFRIADNAGHGATLVVVATAGGWLVDSWSDVV